MPNNSILSSQTQKFKILAHCIFWLAYLVFVSFLLSNFLEIQGALIRTVIMGIFHAGLVYIHLMILVPRYYDQQKYWLYGMTTLGFLILFSLMRIAVDYEMAKISHLYQDLVMSPIHVLAVFMTGVVVLLITTPIKLVEDRYQKLQLQQQLKNQRLEAELKFLKAQVNPHFLFNALNNIYTLAFTESKQTAPTVLKLSEMMRYMLYECKAERVPLSSEINYLRNFIELQQLKTEEKQNIEFSVSGEIKKYMIPPLLFVPLFENAFKHGNLEKIGTGWLKANLQIKEEKLLFQIENTVGETRNKDQVGGIGLENIQKRLELLFPGEFEFSAEKQDDIFSVFISLPLAHLLSKTPNPASLPRDHSAAE
ncbi:MAG: histidine kinase [Bacteroidetes bacterium]|nr:histidine kinase [Bacteroidota bacterium]